jgi:hypothetical protein
MPNIYNDLPARIIWRSPCLPAHQSARTPAPVSALSPIRQPADYTFLASPASPAPSSPGLWEDDGWVPPPETWHVRPPSLDPPETPSSLISRFSEADPPDSPSDKSWITSSRQSSLNIHTVECSWDPRAPVLAVHRRLALLLRHHPRSLLPLVANAHFSAASLMLSLFHFLGSPVAYLLVSAHSLALMAEILSSESFTNTHFTLISTTWSKISRAWIHTHWSRYQDLLFVLKGWNNTELGGFGGSTSSRSDEADRCIRLNTDWVCLGWDAHSWSRCATPPLDIWPS